MATLRNKRKLAAVSRETPEGSRGSRGRNVLDPELTQDFISQVSEEMEGRVTKKLSKEFNKTESRILGALSELDEFLLNPQVRTCSVAAGGTSRNFYSENRETHGGSPLKRSQSRSGVFSSPLWSTRHLRGRDHLTYGDRTLPSDGDRKLLSHGDRKILSHTFLM